MIFKAIVHKDEFGYFAEFPGYPGCFTQGDTLEELKYMIRDVLSLYFNIPASDVHYDMHIVESMLEATAL